MAQLKIITTLFVLLCLANITMTQAATIDPVKGRWRVDMERTLENFRRFAPQNIPVDGFPAAIVKSMKNMSLYIGRSRYVFRAGKRKIINSRYEIISLSDDGIMMRINVGNKVREQLLALTPEGKLRVIAMNDGKPEPRASANYFIWYRLPRIMRVRKPEAIKSETVREQK